MKDSSVTEIGKVRAATPGPTKATIAGSGWPIR